MLRGFAGKKERNETEAEASPENLHQMHRLNSAPCAQMESMGAPNRNGTRPIIETGHTR
jgi:hypothetical protein